jgi:hypothetical protein
MSFMQNDIRNTGYFAVETTHGTEIVCGDDIGRTMSVAAEALANYVTGKILDPDEVVEYKTGWLARLSAPGYLDCTDWTAHATEAEALEYLEEAYGEA